MRVRSDFWVSAYIRRCATADVTAVLRRRGAAEAGAIFIKLDRLDGHAQVYGPAPQSEMSEDGVERLWTRLHKDEWIDPPSAEERIAKEVRFDPDLWLIEVEDRLGRHFLDLA